MLASGDLTTFLDYGQLGLCALILLVAVLAGRWLVAGHRQDRAELLAALTSQTENVRILCTVAQKALDNNTEALRRMTEALRDRPCLMEDSRLHGRPT